MNVFIWGAGAKLEDVYHNLNKTCTVIGILDNNEQKQGLIWNNIPIISPQKIREKEYDAVIVSVLNDSPIEEECINMKIPKEKVIFYWRDPAEAFFENRILKSHIYRARLDSAPYEWGVKSTPVIIPGKELLLKIIEDKSSLCRFGDGEFEIIFDRNRAWFQKKDPILQMRLKEVLKSDNVNVNIAIAQNFKHLEQFKEKAADDIRLYMEGNTRKQILNILDNKKIYYDAYVSRPYIFYKNNTNAEILFPLYKQIWKKRNLLLVEGKYSRMGMKNDLFDGCLSIKRLLCPSQNAWDKYSEILASVMQYTTKDTLVCISLGPTATVLAYDLARAGIQALDIGQLDNEYDWYKKRADCREPIEGKMVAEAGQRNISNKVTEEYLTQIVCEIGN